MVLVPALARLVLDAVAPLRCAGCDEVSRSPICAECGTRIGSGVAPPAVELSRGRAVAAFIFEAEVREVLHRGKFQGNRAALRELARLAAARLELSQLPRPDAIVAIPLGPRRRRQRGYNQAEVVADVFAAAAGLRSIAGLERLRETPPQASRGEAARRDNMAGAFGWRGTELGGAAVWLIDDVLTTGATLEAGAVAVRQAGARQVDAVVIARVP